MAAYYHPQTAPRQRLPPPNLDSLDESSFIRKAPPPEMERSFLIFPALAGPSPNSPTNSPGAQTDISDTHTKPLPSPTGSSEVSLQTSLLNSVAARSSRPPNSSRSNSQGALSAGAFSEWEEIRDGPLPLPGRGRRARRGGHDGPSTSHAVLPAPTRRRREMTELERKGSGWAWTLDGDDLGIGGPELEVDGWKWTVASSSSGGSDLGGFEGETRYEDASSHFRFHPTMQDSVSALESRWGSPTLSEAKKLPDGISISEAPVMVYDGRLARGRQRSMHRSPSRGYSFKLQEPHTYQHRHRARSLSRPPAAASLSSFPFGTIIQALFSIDPDTMALLNQTSTPPSSNAYHRTQPSTLYDIPDDILESDDDKRHATKVEAEHAASQTTRLLRTSEAEASANAACTTIKKGFDVTQHLPTNPFAFPVYLLHWSLNLGLRGVMALNGGRAEREN